VTDTAKSTIAILGGTGKEGKGLAFRWAKAGRRVILGSRLLERAQEAAQEVNDRLQSDGVTGADNPTAAKSADIVAITVPYSAHRVTLESLKPFLEGKLLIDVTVPLNPGKITRVQMPPAGSAAQEALEILGEQAMVAAAFQNISYEHLLNDLPVECDVLVTGSSKEARVAALELVAEAGLTGWDAGALENSVVAEGLTSVLININKQYGSTHAGIKITGIVRNQK